MAAPIFNEMCDDSGLSRAHDEAFDAWLKFCPDEMVQQKQTEADLISRHHFYDPLFYHALSKDICLLFIKQGAQTLTLQHFPQGWSERKTLLKRLTLIVKEGVIETVHYPVFPSDADANWAMAYLKSRLP